MVAAEMVRGVCEGELPQRAGGVKRNVLLIRQSTAKERMVIVIPAWKVGKEVVDSHRETRMKNAAEERRMQGGGERCQ